MTGKITPPFTNHRGVKSFKPGSIYQIDYSKLLGLHLQSEKYFEFQFNEHLNSSEDEMAEQLSHAFKTAVRKRTLSIFGQTAISLSGGLDSRTILCSAKENDSTWAFCFFDIENREYQIAKEIAKKLGVKFIPCKRDFDYYGDNAVLGAKISGAMGDLANNHYLGYRDHLIDLGIENILTGFYCDYLFKGLTLDKSPSKIFRHEKLSPFKYESYRPHVPISRKYGKEVYRRLDNLFPKDIQTSIDSKSKLAIESKRVFPLCYEPDNQETTIPQRVLPWYLPIVDNDIIDVYLKIPAKYKLNISMYSKMVHMQCKNLIPDIINANTGVKVNANKLHILYSKYINALKYRMRKHSKKIATDGSWPNWEFYFKNSAKIKDLWTNDTQLTKDIYIEIMGYDAFKRDIRSFTGTEHELLRRIITQKIWLEQQL
jgi:hypothetical protein